MSGLFDRLKMEPTSARPLSRRERAGEKFDSIKRHLETLLNTRQGCSQSAPTLGLRDFNGHDLSSGDLLQQVSTDIRSTVEHFEPRIRVHALKAVPDTHAPLELHFHLDCQVRVNDHTEQLQIELLVNGNSRYTRVR
ncbi:type VI secretion system baseplate subunit TssE [Pseudomonas alkylphenolica]|uniref:Type VI secretion system baseplate subunit TssE n=1 Tax=Pseudomonas alkylphenolica TaxID=237609 RepID=A0A443ZJQ2_9PSED|nr:type VI secretion system baseplate subunit TssE [Pseudomonas alkylphenolica]RWU19111.1 type VI secretion system baseplate subunit TssE [Pseudomonas alkylphenolica]